MKNILKIFINNNILFTLITFIVFICVNILFCLFLLNKYPQLVVNSKISIDQLTHTYSYIVNSIISGKGYVTKLDIDVNIDFFAGRLPFIPYFISFTYLFISDNFFIIYIIKNIIFFSLIFLLLKKIFKKNIYILLILLFIFYNPYNLGISLLIVPEEGYINYLIISLFLIFYSNIKHREIYLSLLLSVIYITKGSICFFVYTFAIYLFFSEKKKLPMLSIMICFVFWSLFVYQKTNKLITPFSLVSIGGVTLASANNEKFLSVYPLESPDVLYDEILDQNLKNTKKIRNEFEFDSYYKDYTLNFIRNNLDIFLKGVIKKLNVIFFNIKRDAQTKGSDNYNKIHVESILNKVLFLLSFFIIIKNIFRGKFSKIDNFCIIFFISYLFPFIVGFVYSRHLVPLYTLSNIYLFIYFYDKNYFLKSESYLNIK